MSSLMICIGFFISFFFLWEAVRILRGLRLSSKPASGDQRLQHGITLIIPVRNEEKRFPALVKALTTLKKPEPGFEVILVDDHSDVSPEIWFSNEPSVDFPLKLIRLQDIFPGKTGKAMAIHAGILHASYPVVTLTDADAVFHPDWLIFLAEKFSSSSRPDMICGPAISGTDGFGKSAQKLDWMMIMAVANGSFNSGHPLSAIGNNMAFLKESYLQTGGYEKFPFSVTEDFQLFFRFIQSKKVVLWVASESAKIETEPNRTFREFVNQRKRWASGGLSSPLRSYWIVLVSNLMTFLLLFGWLIHPVYWVFWSGTKLAADWQILSRFSVLIGNPFKFSDFIRYELIFPAINLYFPLELVLNPKISWKGRSF